MGDFRKPYLTPVERLAIQNGTGDGGSSFAVNLSSVTDYGEVFFIDRAKQARGWRGEGLATLDSGVDSDGNPIALNTGDSAFEFFFSAFRDGGGEYIAPAPDRSGRFRVSWEGEATVTGGGGANRTDLTANSFEFDCEWVGNKAFVVTPTNPANLPRNLKIIDVNLLAAHAAGDIFDPLYLSTLPSGGCFRFMDWMGTNNSAVTGSSDYPAQNSQTWSRVPFEVMTALCNAKSADMWVCIPHAADDSFVSEKLTYVEQHLSNTLKVRVELSNEIWNTGTFDHPLYFKGLAESVWGVADGYANATWLHYAGKRFVQVMQLAQTVFADSPARLIGVIGGCAANKSLTEAYLAATAWQTYEPESYVRPSTLCKEISIAPYINWTGDKIEHGDAIKAALDISEQAAVDYILGMVPDSFARSKAQIDNHIQLCLDNPARLTMYEYNQHYDLIAANNSDLVVSGIPVVGALGAFMAATYSVEMAAAEDALRAYFRANAGTLMCFFADVSRASRFGTWGAATHIGHDSAIWNALKAWHTANPRWWSQ